MTENKTIHYKNGTFSVVDNLFYENNIRLGYFEDEEKEEILENNHKAVVDRLTNLRDSNIDLKRSNKKLRKENQEFKQLIKKVMDERVVDYPLLCKLKEMVKE